MTDLMAERLTAESLVMEQRAVCPWQVGKVYWMRGHGSGRSRRRALIVSTKLRASQPIAGIVFAHDADDEDEVSTWSLDGRYTGNGCASSLDLTMEEAPVDPLPVVKLKENVA